MPRRELRGTIEAEKITLKGAAVSNPVFAKLDRTLAAQEQSARDAGVAGAQGYGAAYGTGYAPENGAAYGTGYGADYGSANPPAGTPYQPYNPAYGNGYNAGYNPAANPASPAGAANPAWGGQPVQQSPYAGMEQSFQAPAADAVDRGQMTYDDVVVKAGISLAVMLVAGILAWATVRINMSAGAVISFAGVFAAFILAMVNSFSKKVRPGLILAYAATEGLALGAISSIFERAYPGIVLQAVLATAAVFGVTLALFASGKVRNSSKLAKFTMISLIGILVYRVIASILVLVGVTSTSLEYASIAGFPIGLVVGVFAVLIGAFSLIQDFDSIKQSVERGVPAQLAWQCVFGLLVTIVWMYIEILRLIAILRDR